jgi:hypothetical protein
MLSSPLLVLGISIAILGGPLAAGQDPKDGRHDEMPAPQLEESSPGAEYYCRAPEMPISWGTSAQPVKIVHSDAVFTALGTAIPALDVLNTQTSPITTLAFVVDYLDKAGHRVTTAAIAAAATGYQKTAHLPFSVEGFRDWKEPLAPGMTARVDGFYDSVRTLTCPQSARIIFVTVKFMNGTVQQYAADGWSVPPLPRFVPEGAAACPPVQKNPTQIRARLRISSTGEVTGISGPVLTKDNPEQVAWITTQLKQWKFQPPLLDGHPREGDLEVEFVLYGGPELNFGAISLDSPATLILFYPRKDPSRGCVQSFGFLHEAVTTP